MTVTLDLSEVHALARDIHRNADQVRPKARVIVAAGAQRTVAAIQQGTPVDTGLLRSSHSADVDDLHFEAGPTVEYGEYVELGTSEMAAQPHVGPGFDKTLPKIEAAAASLGAQIVGRG